MGTLISAGSRAERPALQPPLNVALGSETSYFELARSMADKPAEPASGAPTRVPLSGVSENKGQPAFSFGSPGSAPSFSFGPKAAAAAVAPGETFVFGAVRTADYGNKIHCTFLAAQLAFCSKSLGPLFVDSSIIGFPSCTRWHRIEGRVEGLQYPRVFASVLLEQVVSDRCIT